MYAKRALIGSPHHNNLRLADGLKGALPLVGGREGVNSCNMADDGGEIRSSEPLGAADGGADALDVDLDEVSLAPNHSNKLIRSFPAQLDDAEFEIPAVATPPSLESILNEQDDHSDAEDLGLIAEVCHHYIEK